MPVSGIAATAVVHVVFRAGFAALANPFARDGTAAMPASHEFACESHLMGVVHMPAKQRLNTVPSGSVHQRFVTAREPVFSEGNFAQIGPVHEDRIELATREFDRM